LRFRIADLMVNRQRGHFRITEMASDIGEYEGMRPEGLDPPSSVPLDGRGESPLKGDIPSFPNEL